LTDYKLVVAAIEVGDYDGRLADIVGACRERLSETGSSLRWQIAIGDETWTEDTVTLGEERWVESHTGINWTELVPLRSAEVATAYIAAHWHKIGGMSVVDSLAKADKLGVREVIAAVTEYEVPAPDPKDPVPPTT
jgi:hypothetical protein